MWGGVGALLWLEAGGRMWGRQTLELWLVDISVAVTPNDVVRKEIAENIGIGY